VWRLIVDLVRNLNDVILQTLPSFWKVAKGYMEGKYQKVRFVLLSPCCLGRRAALRRPLRLRLGGRMSSHAASACRRTRRPPRPPLVARRPSAES